MVEARASADIRPTEVCPTEVCPTDVCPTEVCPTDVLAPLRGALDALLALDPTVWRDGETLLGLMQQISRGEALVCRQAAAFDRVAEWALDGAQNAAAWLTTRARCDRQQARLRIRLGHASGTMELVSDAFAAGTIGIDHVDRLAKARDRSTLTAIAFANDQSMLLEWAQTKKFHQFVHDLDEWTRDADIDESESRSARQHRQRRFHLSQSFENTWFFDGVFDPISGQIVHDVLTRIERQLFEADWADAKQRLHREPCVADLARTAPQRRVDALVEMARRAETTPKDGQRPAPLFTVLIGIDAFTRTCELASSTILTPGMTAHWLNESIIERIVFDGPDRAIAVGHQRAFTGALRRAIQIRDRTCAHPYCDEPAECCQIDHIDPWAQGGKTTQQNARLLCGFHNRLRNPDHLQPGRSGRRDRSGQEPPRRSEKE